jgi:hypothetical protein
VPAVAARTTIDHGLLPLDPDGPDVSELLLLFFVDFDDLCCDDEPVSLEPVSIPEVSDEPLPTEPLEPNEPLEPVDPLDPGEPVEPIEPAEPLVPDVPCAPCPLSPSVPSWLPPIDPLLPEPSDPLLSPVEPLLLLPPAEPPPPLPPADCAYAPPASVNGTATAATLKNLRRPRVMFSSCRHQRRFVARGVQSMFQHAPPAIKSGVGRTRPPEPRSICGIPPIPRRWRIA